MTSNSARADKQGDRNRSSLALQLSDKDLGQLVECIADGVVIHQDDRVVYANPTALAQFGVNSAAELIGHKMLDLVAPDDRLKMRAFNRRLFAKEGAVGRQRFSRRQLDGTLIEVETVTARVDWKGRPALLGVARNVTEQEKARIALMESEARLEGFLSTAAHWLWETDAEHRFTFFSESLSQFGYSRAQMLGNTRWKLAGASLEDDPAWRKHVADLNARRPFRDFEYRSVSPTGNELHRSISGDPIFNAGGVFQGYRGTSRDITERKRNEQAIRESEQRFKLALEGAKGGVFDIDLVSGKVTYDEQSASMLGYNRADEIPSQLSDWVERLHPDDREAARNRLDQLLEGETETLRSEQRQRTKSGEWLWFSCISKVVERDDDGRPLRLIGIRFDITERKQAETTIAHMALHDALTKLPNRAYFSTELERTFTMARRDGTRLAVLFLDLDHFKDINDTLGHSVGDKLLVEVAGRLKSCLRKGDLVARFGGDEFVMAVTPSCDATTIGYLADRITEMIAMPYEFDGQTVHIGISIGIAIFPDDGLDTERVLANADLALYTAKSAGRRTWRVFDRGLQKRLRAQRSLDQELRQAFDRHQFELHYQPLIDIADFRISGFEALIRWNHPKHGQVPPDAFIPAAERNRLIIPLTEWVLQEASIQQQRWASARLDARRIAVNVSPILFKLKGFIDLFDQCMIQHGCGPGDLTIEITEGTLIDEANTMSVLRALQERGVTIAIDDFGMGYSSMVRLKTLPVDVLKIDRSFLTSVINSESDASIVESLVNVGHSLGKKVVAEGVETIEQMSFLESIGCDTAQGFLFNRPMPAPDVAPWLEQWQTSGACCSYRQGLFGQRSDH